MDICHNCRPPPWREACTQELEKVEGKLAFSHTYILSGHRNLMTDICIKDYPLKNIFKPCYPKIKPDWNTLLWRVCFLEALAERQHSYFIPFNLGGFFLTLLSKEVLPSHESICLFLVLQFKPPRKRQLSACTHHQDVYKTQKVNTPWRGKAARRKVHLVIYHKLVKSLSISGHFCAWWLAERWTLSLEDG